MAAGRTSRTDEGAAAAVAAWTLVSRATGLVRVAVAGAILGPTFFANIFLATNTLPNLTYNLVAGSLLVSVIVPSVVHALESGGVDRARRLCGQITGVVVAGLAAAAFLVVLLGPVIVQLVTTGIDDPRAAAAARADAWVLLLLVVPQIVLYGIAAVGAAAQHARGRFALAAAAPVAENLGLITTLLVGAHVFGSAFGRGTVPTEQLLLLGVGSTASVATHAALQVFGAARVGLPLRPAWGWQDPDIRRLVRRVAPTAAAATTDAAACFVLIVAAAAVPGGVIAVQIGLQFHNLPLALGARAISTVAMPALSRAVVRQRLDAFASTYTRALAQAWFLAVPAAIGLLTFASSIAPALAFGDLAGERGTALVASSIAAFGLAVLGAAPYEVARQAAYARLDAHGPMLAGCAQLVIVLAATVAVAAASDGRATVVGLGVAFAGGNAARAFVVDRRIRLGLPHPPARLTPALLRHVAVSSASVALGLLLTRFVALAVDGKAGVVLAVAVGGFATLATYLAVQFRLDAPELASAARARQRADMDIARHLDGAR